MQSSSDPVGRDVRLETDILCHSFIEHDSEAGTIPETIVSETKVIPPLITASRIWPVRLAWNTSSVTTCGCTILENVLH